MRKRKPIRCKVCGYPWFQLTDKTPERCPNKDCRSTHWNTGKKPRKTRKMATVLTFQMSAPQEMSA